MLPNSSNIAPISEQPHPLRRSLKYRIAMAVGLLAWVFLGFALAQALVVLALMGLRSLGLSFQGMNENVFNTLVAAIMYGLAIFLVVGVPWVVKRRPTTWRELGLQRLLQWSDFLWTGGGFVVYIILSVLVTTLGGLLLTFVDFSQTQETGFSQIASQLEYIVAFISLVVVAPIAEEILFRGYLFGKLKKYLPVWISILLTSLLFAAVHGQWNVGLDVFALSIVLCVLRLMTGSLWSSIFLHMLKNGIAYYFLFINPLLTSTLGG